MTYVPCRGCIEKGREPPCYVPSELQSCCDCYLFTPQDREREFDRLRCALDRSQRTQRDRFAEHAMGAIVSGLLQRVEEKPILRGLLSGAGVLGAAAYVIADSMMEAREAAQKGSSRS